MGAKRNSGAAAVETARATTTILRVTGMLRNAFINEWQITTRLAYARRLLAEALDEGLTEQEALELDDLLQMPSWTQSRPAPPPELMPPPLPG